MKKLNELTKEDCQSFLDELFEDSNAEFKDLILPESNEMISGIEYSIKSEDFDGGDRYVSISNPELLTWMYEHDVDISTPLTQLKYEYNEMDETNSILFEYAMEIGKILNEPQAPEARYSGSEEKEKIKKIKDLQKSLINKI